LLILSAAIIFAGVPLKSAYGQQGSRPNDHIAGNEQPAHPAHPRAHNKAPRKKNSLGWIYNGSGFGPAYNPHAMSGLNANGNTGNPRGGWTGDEHNPPKY
jgi:hypothetical protein